MLERTRPDEKREAHKRRGAGSHVVDDIVCLLEPWPIRFLTAILRPPLESQSRTVAVRATLSHLWESRWVLLSEVPWFVMPALCPRACDCTCATSRQSSSSCFHEDTTRFASGTFRSAKWIRNVASGRATRREKQKIFVAYSVLAGKIDSRVIVFRIESYAICATENGMEINAREFSDKYIFINIFK